VICGRVGCGWRARSVLTRTDGSVSRDARARTRRRPEYLRHGRCSPPEADHSQREQDPPHQEPQIPEPDMPAQRGPVHAPCWVDHTGENQRTCKYIDAAVGHQQQADRGRSGQQPPAWNHLPRPRPRTPRYPPPPAIRTRGSLPSSRPSSASIALVKLSRASAITRAGGGSQPLPDVFALRRYQGCDRLDRLEEGNNDRTVAAACFDLPSRRGC